jgi:hypothetical protein
MMSSRRRRKFQRPRPKRLYKNLFVIATEGIKTERQYFAIFDGRDSIVHVRCLRKNQGNSPIQVLKQMQAHLDEFSLRKNDQAWLVVDKDQWTEEQLAQLFEWSEQDNNYGLALSNPKFEYWLLLHFEDASGATTSQRCTAQLRRHLPNYDKGIDRRKFTTEAIQNAISRAKQADIPPCSDWPRTPPGTTVYRLVQLIMDLGKK